MYARYCLNQLTFSLYRPTGFVRPTALLAPYTALAPDRQDGVPRGYRHAVLAGSTQNAQIYPLLRGLGQVPFEVIPGLDGDCAFEHDDGDNDRHTAGRWRGTAAIDGVWVIDLQRSPDG
jgi:hypothetical protein